MKNNVILSIRKTYLNSLIDKLLIILLGIQRLLLNDINYII